MSEQDEVVAAVAPVSAKAAEYVEANGLEGLVGLCECGCGLPVPLVRVLDRYEQKLLDGDAGAGDGEPVGFLSAAGKDSEGEDA